MTNETMKNIESEIKSMVNDLQSLDEAIYAHHHKVEYKINTIEATLKSINYYRDLEIKK